MKASRYGHADTVRILVEAGADMRGNVRIKVKIAHSILRVDDEGV